MQLYAKSSSHWEDFKQTYKVRFGLGILFFVFLSKKFGGVELKQLAQVDTLVVCLIGKLFFIDGEALVHADMERTRAVYMVTDPELSVGRVRVKINLV